MLDTPDADLRRTCPSPSPAPTPDTIAPVSDYPHCGIVVDIDDEYTVSDLPGSRGALLRRVWVSSANPTHGVRVVNIWGTQQDAQGSHGHRYVYRRVR